ncbi:helix-turn-helix domain-containing protein [Pseudochrobactrum sp. MP213Fo]|uniref:helix-turn-helix domain-containing protein n=1 Tax=Pseudochrobactrum sp. MP213Fo TaxID=3022250 RepID=UPI003BA08D8A
MQKNFVNNLKFACSTRHSVSEICRDLCINRQQFNRYINGQSEPSPFNLRKIADYFHVKPEEFQLSEDKFHARLSKRNASTINNSDYILDFFKAERSSAEQYLGDYQTFYVSPSWPGYIICSFTRITKEKDYIKVKSIERIYDPNDEVQQKSKYAGLFAISRNKVFIVEKSYNNPSIIAETILQPFETHQKNYLKGLTIGVSWRQDNTPYAAKTIWKKLNKNINIKNTIKKCGRYSHDSHELPAPVKLFFAPDEAKQTILI